MILVLLADGFEEIEALTPVDMLRRAGLSVSTVGISGKTVTGAHRITVSCDLLPDDVRLDDAEMVILPGGMPGTLNLYESKFTERAVRSVLERGGRVAAICAAPLILGRYGLLRGRAATCYPGFEDELRGAYITDRGVVTDGQITTARGMGVALAFSKELISLLISKEKAEELSNAICEEKAETLQEESEIDKFFDYLINEVAEEEDACTQTYAPALPKADTPKSNEPTSDDDAEAQEMLVVIADTLAKFKVKAEITDYVRGATVTLFHISLDKETPVRDILKLKDELYLDLGANVRFIAPIPGEKAVGLEVINRKRAIVGFREIAESDAFTNSGSTTTVCLGTDVRNNAVVADVSRMPHMIVAGATGMGKSVAIHSMIASLLLKAKPDEVKLMLIDPKQVEFTAYNDIPHLITPIIHDPVRAAAALGWAVEEMDRRYSILKESGKRNIKDHNAMVGVKKKLPYVVIIIDELADLMLCAKDDVEVSIVRLAQKARAAGIHLIVGTQRPTPNVITGYIKANVPSRLCCKVMSVKDSRTVIDQIGAEELTDRGDALYFSSGSLTPTRIQCAYISDSECYEIAEAVKGYKADISYEAEINKYIKRYIFKRNNPILFDAEFRAVVEFAISSGRISSSLLQRAIGIGYGKAAKFIDKMEELGFVSEMNGNRPREILITREEWDDLLSKIDN